MVTVSPWHLFTQMVKYVCRLWQDYQMVTQLSDGDTTIKWWHDDQMVSRLSDGVTTFRWWHDYQMLTRLSDGDTTIRWSLNLKLPSETNSQHLNHKSSFDFHLTICCYCHHLIPCHHLFQHKRVIWWEFGTILFHIIWSHHLRRHQVPSSGFN